MLARLTRAFRSFVADWGGRDLVDPTQGGRWPASSLWPSPNQHQLARRWRDASRANYLSANSPTAASLAEKWASHCVGVGPTARSGHPDEAMRRALEAVWQRWAQRCDIEGIDDLTGCLNLIIRSTVNSGEAFARLVAVGRA